MIKKRLIGLLISTSVMVGFVSPAAAFRAQDHSVRAVERAVKNMEQTVESTHESLIRALRLQTGEQSAYSDKQIEAFKRIQDASSQNATELARQQIRARAESGEFDPNPAACLLLDLFKGGGGSGSSGPATGTSLVERATAQSRSVGQKGPSAAAYEMAQKSTIIDGQDASVTAGVYLEEPTVDLSDPQMAQAAADFYMLVNDPIPLKEINPENITNPETATQAAIQRSRKARSSVIGQNWAMTMNMASPTTPKANAEPLLKGVSYNREVPDTLSELQILDLLVLSNYLPSDYNKGSATPSQSLDKIHKLLSVMARMQYMQLELQRRQLMTDSTMLAKMIENDGNFSN